MGNDGPAMRAPLTQSLLATIHSLEPAVRGDVLGGVSRSTIDEVTGALPIVWIPFPIHMEIVASLARVLGTEQYVSVWRRTMVGAFARPFLRSFVAMSKTLFDFDPKAFLTKAPHMYHHVTRGLGSLTFASDGGQTGLASLWGFPSGYAFRVYAEGLGGCLHATLDILSAQGAVELVDFNDRVGSARYRMSWG